MLETTSPPLVSVSVAIAASVHDVLRAEAIVRERIRFDTLRWSAVSRDELIASWRRDARDRTAPVVVVALAATELRAELCREDALELLATGFARGTRLNDRLTLFVPEVADDE